MNVIVNNKKYQLTFVSDDPGVIDTICRDFGGSLGKNLPTTNRDVARILRNANTIWAAKQRGLTVVSI